MRYALNLASLCLRRPKMISFIKLIHFAHYTYRQQSMWGKKLGSLLGHSSPCTLLQQFIWKRWKNSINKIFIAKPAHCLHKSNILNPLFVLILRRNSTFVWPLCYKDCSTTFVEDYTGWSFASYISFNRWSCVELQEHYYSVMAILSDIYTVMNPLHPAPKH